MPLSERALAMAERSGDPSALIAAIDARHHAVDFAEHVTERLALGARALELAATENRPEAALWAHLWRIDAGYQIGSMTTVDAELRALDALADRLAWPLARWHLLRARAARSQLAGDFAESEALALAFREIGQQIQDRLGAGPVLRVHLRRWSSGPVGSTRTRRCTRSATMPTSCRSCRRCWACTP